MKHIFHSWRFQCDHLSNFKITSLFFHLQELFPFSRINLLRLCFFLISIAFFLIFFSKFTNFLLDLTNQCTKYYHHPNGNLVPSKKKYSFESNETRSYRNGQQHYRSPNPTLKWIPPVYGLTISKWSIFNHIESPPLIAFDSFVLC